MKAGPSRTKVSPQSKFFFSSFERKFMSLRCAIALRAHIKVLQRDEFFELKPAAWCDGGKVQCEASLMIVRMTKRCFIASSLG